jgi:peptidoglycan/LPS O-acetylase OafA/YrhL
VTVHTPRAEGTAYRADLDGLRGVAVLSVVAFHAAPHSFPGGFVGVDAFFVVSGFLISRILLASLEERRFSIGDFYVRRVRRIFPALLVVLVLCLAFGWTALIAPPYDALGEHTAAGAGFASNLLLWSESGYFDRRAITKPLLHLWSLGVEEQFYLVWPWILFALFRLRVRFPGNLSVPLGVLTLAAASFLLNVVLLEVDPVGVFYAPFTRFWELGLGALVASPGAAGLSWKPLLRDLASLTGACLLALAFAIVTDARPFPGFLGLLPTVGTALLVLAGEQAWVNRTLLSRSWLVAVGLVSYPLYLFHWPLLSFATTQSRFEPAWIPLGGAIAASLLLSWATFRFIERPIRATRSPRTALALVGAMTVVGGLGFAVHRAHGFPARPVNAGLPPPYDWKVGYRYRSCFLDDKQEPSAFAPECIPRPSAGARTPLLLLWGDSHAAALSPALRDQPGFRLAQLTTSGCPPVLGMHVESRPQCTRINEAVLAEVKQLSPDVVVLAAYWSLYDGIDGYDRLDDEELLETLKQLEASGVPRVIVMGHLPTFTVDEPEVARATFVPHRYDRTLEHFDPRSRLFDDRIRAVASRSHASFVSPIDLLCNAEGCLVSASPVELLPVAWDYGHLTKEGATLLARRANLIPQ